MDEALVAWAKSLDAKTEATLEKVKRKREKEVSSLLRELSTIEDCMEVLEGMEDVDDTAYLKALEKFTSSDWRRMFMKMMDSNEADNNDSSSESDSSSDLDDSLGELLLVTRLYDHYSRLNKEPCMTSHFSGRQYVIDLLNGHPHSEILICIVLGIGKYYVVDSGYANMSGFLEPYRKVHYHLRDFRGRGKRPRGAMELFNFKHSSLCNVVERCIGVLKNRFPILKLMPNYPIRKQRCIPVACCAVHNFIRMQSRNDTLFQQFEDNDVDVVDEESSGPNQEGENMHLNDDNVMNDVRDHIAGSMWLDYVNNN
ncbi:unnamed protein product [Malus baccata var. baccata]